MKDCHQASSLKVLKADTYFMSNGRLRTTAAISHGGVKDRSRKSRKFCALNASLYYSWNTSNGATNLATDTSPNPSVMPHVEANVAIRSSARNLRYYLSNPSRCRPLFSAHPIAVSCLFIGTHVCLYKVACIKHFGSLDCGRHMHERVQSEVRNGYY